MFSEDAISFPQIFSMQGWMNPWIWNPGIQVVICTDSPQITRQVHIEQI